MTYTIKGRLELVGPDGLKTWEDFYQEFEAEDRDAAGQLFDNAAGALEDVLDVLPSSAGEGEKR